MYFHVCPLSVLCVSVEVQLCNWASEKKKTTANILVGKNYPSAVVYKTNFAGKIAFNNGLLMTPKLHSQ